MRQTTNKYTFKHLKLMDLDLFGTLNKQWWLPVRFKRCLSGTALESPDGITVPTMWVCEQVVHRLSTHTASLLLALTPPSHPLCVELQWVRRGEFGGGGGGGGRVRSTIVGRTLSTVGTPAGSLPSRGCWEPQKATMEGESSRVNVTNTRSLILLPCTSAPGQFQKPDPLFFSLSLSLKSPLLHHAPPLFFSPTVILQQEKGRAFVVAHSVTQTQDLRLPVIKWKLSPGLSQRSLCSCRLGERGGNSYFSTWKGSRRGHEGRLFTSDTIDFESRRFSESGRECLPGCWHHVLIEFDCQRVSKGPKQAYYENALLGSCRM